jgi:cysteine-rich repeat protein
MIEHTSPFARRSAGPAPWLVLLVLLVLLAVAGCGSASDPAPEPTPRAAVCGNGAVETGEECDDGNAVNGDACLSTCQRAANWVSGDVHAHTTGCSRPFVPEAVVDRLKAQGLQVGSVLVWGEGFRNDSQLFTGRDHPLSDSSFILHYDLEVSHFPAAMTGHLILLGLDSLAFSADVFSTPWSGLPVAEWARRQPRAVVGMAHGSTGRRTAIRCPRAAAACRGRSSSRPPAASWTSWRWS